jgi:hypothetical protein
MRSKTIASPSATRRAIGSSCTPVASASISGTPPPMRPFSSITRGPSGVSLTSVCKAPTVMPIAATAALATSTIAAHCASSNAAGMKKPVSRNGSAGGKRPVIARWLIRPALTTLSTET